MAHPLKRDYATVIPFQLDSGADRLIAVKAKKMGLGTFLRISRVYGDGAREHVVEGFIWYPGRYILIFDLVPENLQG